MRAAPTPAVAACLDPDDVAEAGPDASNADSVDARVGRGAAAAHAKAAAAGGGGGAAALAEVPSASSATAACLMRA